MRFRVTAVLLILGMLLLLASCGKSQETTTAAPSEAISMPTAAQQSSEPGSEQSTAVQTEASTHEPATSDSLPPAVESSTLPVESTEAATEPDESTEAATEPEETETVPATEENPVTVDKAKLLQRYFEEVLLPERGLMDQEAAFAISDEGAILWIKGLVLYPTAGFQFEPYSVGEKIIGWQDSQKWTEHVEQCRQNHQGIFFYKIIEDPQGFESKMLIGSYVSETGAPQGVTHWELYGVRESEVVLLNEFDVEKDPLINIMQEQYVYLAHTSAEEIRIIFIEQHWGSIGEVSCHILLTDGNMKPVSRLEIYNAEGGTYGSAPDASRWHYLVTESFFDGRKEIEYTIPATIPVTDNGWLYNSGKIDAGLSHLFGKNGYEMLSQFCDVGYLLLNEDLYPYWGQMLDQNQSDTALKWNPSKVRQGDIVSFGQFEQDNNPDNGPEEIEWIVLEQDSETVTLISRYILDRQMYAYGEYADQGKYVNATIRSWLNIDFGGRAFSWAERSALRGIAIEDEANPLYPQVSLTGDVIDMVSFLSARQVEEYFPKEGERLCQGTAYALGKGLFQADNGYSPWWTRTPGADLKKMTLVRSDGSINWDGRAINDTEISFGIRPVIRLSKEALKNRNSD